MSRLLCSLLTFALPFVLAVTPVGAQTPAAPALIDVKAAGTGKPPLVFIPGLASPGSVWDETVAEFSKTNTCYVVNVAGFGGLPPTGKHEHLLADVRDALIEYLRVNKVEHPVIVGHSLGGTLALDLAATAPELPGSLVIVDSLPFLAAVMGPGIKTEADARPMAAGYGATLAAQTPEQFAAAQRQFVGGMVTDPAKAAAIAMQTGKSDPATTGQAMMELISHDLRPSLSKIKCPVLVLGALADKVNAGTPREAMEKPYRDQYTSLPQARFEFFDKARHFIMVDDPSKFIELLRTEMNLRKMFHPALS